MIKEEAQRIMSIVLAHFLPFLIWRAMLLELTVTVLLSSLGWCFVFFSKSKLEAEITKITEKKNPLKWVKYALKGKNKTKQKSSEYQNGDDMT